MVLALVFTAVMVGPGLSNPAEADLNYDTCFSSTVILPEQLTECLDAELRHHVQRELGAAAWAEAVQQAVDAFLAQLEAGRQAEIAAAQARAARAPTPASSGSPQVYESGSGDCSGVPAAAAYIYEKESGCRTWAVNGGGCRGIGQACPGSKLPCGDYDFACQHEWFTGYMLGRYGSWDNAVAFWNRNHWW